MSLWRSSETVWPGRFWPLLPGHSWITWCRAPTGSPEPGLPGLAQPDVSPNFRQEWDDSAGHVIFSGPVWTTVQWGSVLMEARSQPGAAVRSPRDFQPHMQGALGRNSTKSPKTAAHFCGEPFTSFSCSWLLHTDATDSHLTSLAPLSVKVLEKNIQPSSARWGHS